MLEKVLADFLAPLGMDGWFSLNVHSAFAIILFICTSILFIRDMMKNWIDDKEWSSRPIPTKVRIFTKGILGLTIVGYIVYLLVAWNTWTWTTPLCAVMAPLMIFSAMALSYFIILICSALIYSWIKDMISYLMKKE